MRFLVDTNILAYAVNRDCDEHEAAAGRLADWLGGTTGWCLTWGIVYEFLRIATHPRVFRRPLHATEALGFLSPILESDVVTILGPTSRHATVLAATVAELGSPTGNLFHDLQTAVVMRENGVTEIVTADADFRKFPFLKVTNPIRRA